MIAIDEAHIAANVDLLIMTHLNHYEVGVPSCLSISGTPLEQGQSMFSDHVAV